MFRPLHEAREAGPRPEALLPAMPGAARLREADVDPKAAVGPLLPHQTVRALPDPKNFEKDRRALAVPFLTGYDALFIIFDNKGPVRE